jgi:hypothetical protein
MISGSGRCSACGGVISIHTPARGATFRIIKEVI